MVVKIWPNRAVFTALCIFGYNSYYMALDIDILSFSEMLPEVLI